LPRAADARGEPDRKIDIEAGALPQAIAELSRETQVSVGAEGGLPDIRTRALHGKLTVEEALARLLQGSGYTARRVGPTAWRIERQPPPPLQSPPAKPPVAQAVPEAEIIVQATKRSLTVEDAPVAVSVVPVAPEERYDATRGSERLAEQIEGLTVTGEGSGHGRMFLRGVADSPFGGKSQSTVAVLLDDARLTYVAPDPDIRLVDVERVEVLKGPQGSLYGSGALGGIYRIVTRRADPSAFTVAGSASGEIVADGQVGASGSLVVNMPLVPDVAAMRLVAYGEETPGWLDTGEREDSNVSRALGARGGLSIEAGDGWRADATGLGQWLHARDSNYSYQLGSDSRPAQLPEPHSNDLVHGSLRVAREGPTQIVLSTGYTVHDVDDRYDATQGAQSFGLADPQTLDDDSRFRLWDSELRMAGHWGRLGWLGGLSHVASWQDSSRVLEGAGATSLTIETVDRRATEVALFGEATMPLAERLDATLGGRLFHTALHEARADTAANGSQETTQTGLTPSASLAWHPRLGELLYLRYGSASRQGGTTLDAAGQVARLREDDLTTLEGGWRETIGPLALDLGVYQSWWRDIQSDVLLANGLVEAANAGDGAITGAEFSAKLRLGGGWAIDAGAVAQSALLTRDATGLKLHDRRLPVVPSWTLRGALSRGFPIGAWDATASATARYVGPARLSFDPALDRPMGDYLETAIAFRARRNHWLLGVEGRNLFNARGDTFAYGNPLRIFANDQFVRQEPFTLRLSVAYVP